jgi:hypothetical protein
MTIELDRQVGDVATVVSLPEVVIRIDRLVEDPKSSAENIGRAVAVLGTRQLRDLALGVVGSAGLQRHPHRPGLDGLVLASQRAVRGRGASARRRMRARPA